MLMLTMLTMLTTFNSVFYYIKYNNCHTQTMCKCTHSGGDPLKLNEVNCTSTRCPGPARNI